MNRNKAQSLQQAMKGLFGVNIKISPHRLVENNVEQLLGDADVIVDCLDNGASRCVVQTFARDKGVECLHGALAADGQLGRVIWDERFEIDYEDTEGQATCEDGEFLPLIVDTASAMVRCLQDFLKNGRKIGVHIVSYGKIVI